MEAVIDSVSIHRLLRGKKMSRARRRGDFDETFETSLDRHLKKGKLALALDKDGGLINEWCTTCGQEYIKVLITRWESFATLLFVEPENIPREVSRKLRIYGFNDCIDHLILRISMATTDRYVVSEDKHFWDPAPPDKRGDPNARVAKLCKDKLFITVLLLGRLLEIL